MGPPATAARDSIGYRITSADLHNAQAVELGVTLRFPLPRISRSAMCRMVWGVLGWGPLRSSGHGGHSGHVTAGQGPSLHAALSCMHPLNTCARSAAAGDRSIVRSEAWPGLAWPTPETTPIAVCVGRGTVTLSKSVTVCQGVCRSVELCQGVPSSLACCAEGKTRLLRPIREASTIREKMSMSFGIL